MSIYSAKSDPPNQLSTGVKKGTVLSCTTKQEESGCILGVANYEYKVSGSIPFKRPWIFLRQCYGSGSGLNPPNLNVKNISSITT